MKKILLILGILIFVTACSNNDNEDLDRIRKCATAFNCQCPSADNSEFCDCQYCIDMSNPCENIGTVQCEFR